jgi:hypothetical protein
MASHGPLALTDLWCCSVPELPELCFAIIASDWVVCITAMNALQHNNMSPDAFLANDNLHPQPRLDLRCSFAA